LGVLRRLKALDGAARCLLGNHDLHLLAVAHGVRGPGRTDTLREVLDAADCPVLMDWLRHQAMALQLQIAAHKVLMVHAGVLPDWSADESMRLAAEVQDALRSPGYRVFLRDMYGSTPVQWDAGLGGADRLRVIVNALTRMRFCDAQGRMEFHHSGGQDQAPAGYMPWFDVPGRRTAQRHRGVRTLVDLGCPEPARCRVYGQRLRLGRLPERPALGSAAGGGAAAMDDSPGAMRSGAEPPKLLSVSARGKRALRLL